MKGSVGVGVSRDKYGKRKLQPLLQYRVSARTCVNQVYKQQVRVLAAAVFFHSALTMSQGIDLALHLMNFPDRKSMAFDEKACSAHLSVSVWLTLYMWVLVQWKHGAACLRTGIMAAAHLPELGGCEFQRCAHVQVWCGNVYTH